MSNRFTLKDVLLWIIVLLIIPVGYYYYDTYAYDRYSGTFDKHSKEVAEYLKRYVYNVGDGTFPIPYPQLKDGTYVVSSRKAKDFSYFSTPAIMERRLNTLMNSPFFTEEYKPSKEIFFRIDSEKPWFLARGKDSHYDTSTADPIVNPMFLVSMAEPLLLLDKRLPYHDMNVLGIIDLEYELNRLFSMSKLIYSPKAQSIELTVPVSCRNLKLLNLWYSETPYKLSLIGVNARDLGYEYVKADKTLNIQMLNKVNITNSKYKFKDYYGVKGGSPLGKGAEVNQLLPRQPELEFRITKLPARFELTLYKNQNDKKGLKYKINFEPGYYLTDMPEISERWMDSQADTIWTNVLNRLLLSEEQARLMSLDDIKAYYYDNYEKIENIPEVKK